MKVSKKTILSKASMTQNGSRNDAVGISATTIRLKPVTNADRQRLRISSYQYLLP